MSSSTICFSIKLLPYIYNCCKGTANEWNDKTKTKIFVLTFPSAACLIQRYSKSKTIQNKWRIYFFYPIRQNDNKTKTNKILLSETESSITSLPCVRVLIIQPPFIIGSARIEKKSSYWFDIRIYFTKASLRFDCNQPTIILAWDSRFLGSS